MDKFKVELLRATPNPQQLVWMAMHNDYSEEFIASPSQLAKVPSETEAGELIIKHLLKGHKGHFGPIEHPQITLAVGHFPHNVIVQARTHRIGVSFDVQSQRYTSQRVLALGQSTTMEEDKILQEVEELFYVRPVGNYTNRQGAKYAITEEARKNRLYAAYQSAIMYTQLVLSEGYSEEDARDTLAQGIRQHFVVSFNARSLMHFLDLRAKKDAQLEIQKLCELMWPHFEEWMPEIAAEYKEKRWGKARLAP